jgi:hypothetical protein
LDEGVRVNSARVKDFALILTGLLTDYDRKEMVKEIKRRYPTNAYRLGHLLGAAQSADQRAKEMGIWDRDDPEAIMTYLMILKEHFIYERGKFALAPLRQLEKRMHDWVDKGKLPKYGTAKANAGAPSWAKVFG